MKKLDLTGRRYGRLLVLSKKENSKPISWNCLCNCGNIVAVTRKNLTGNRKKSCGCILIENKDKPEDFINKKFGLWSVIKFYGRDKNGNHWLCQCECGTIRAVQATQLKQNYSKSCGCIGKEVRRLRTTKPESPLNLLYRRYNRQAKERQIGFHINKIDFLNIIQLDCYYCGNKPSQISKSYALYNIDLLYNGIDRIESNKEYTITNCVACCAQCNYAKRRLTVEEFKNWIIKVYKHLEL